MSSSSELFPTVAKKLPRSHNALVTYLYKLASCAEGNASFPNPTPTPAMLKDAADALVQANVKAKGGDSVAVSDRREKRKEAEKLIDQYASYVKSTVKAQTTDPTAATTMILSAGLSIRKNGHTPKPPLDARHTGISGEILLLALAAKKPAVYFWEYSLDQVSWTSMPQTMKARTTIKGLTPGHVYYFRLRVQTRKELEDYGQTVRIMVL